MVTLVVKCIFICNSHRQFIVQLDLIFKISRSSDELQWPIIITRIIIIDDNNCNLEKYEFKHCIYMFKTIDLLMLHTNMQMAGLFRLIASIFMSVYLSYFHDFFLSIVIHLLHSLSPCPSICPYISPISPPSISLPLYIFLYFSISISPPYRSLALLSLPLSLAPISLISSTLPRFLQIKRRGSGKKENQENGQ